MSVLNIPSLLVHLEILLHSLKHSFSQTDIDLFIFIFFLCLLYNNYHTVLSSLICISASPVNLNNLLEDKDHA